LTTWSVEYEGATFERFFSSLPEYEQAVLTAAIEQQREIAKARKIHKQWKRQH